MSPRNGGFTALLNTLFNSPRWLTGERFHKGARLADLIHLAAWKTHVAKVRLGRRVVPITLERGEVLASCRYLASRWGVSHSQVWEDLAGWVADGTLKRVDTRQNARENAKENAKENTEPAVYLFVNYETYQPSGSADLTQERTQERTQSRTQGRTTEDLQTEETEETKPAPSAAEKSKKGKRKRKAKTKPSRVTWMTPYWDAWIEVYGGEPPAGQLAEYIKPLDEKHGADRVVAHLRNFMAVTPARFVSLKRFVETFGSWERPQGDPRYDKSLLASDRPIKERG